MWLRNLVFIGFCIAGFAAIAGGLLTAERVDEPSLAHPAQFQSDDFARQLRALNAEFETDWSEAGMAAAPRADDLTIARRISLGLTGTIPSLEEIRSLERQPPEQRIPWWLSHILEDRRYADYVAERLGRAYVGTEGGPFLVYRRRRFVMWLSDRLAENMPYDKLVRTLISDTGLWTDSPAVNFVTVTLDQNNDKGPDEIKLAARTSRAFLGMRIDCLQCHDDNLGTINLGSDADPVDGLQTHFHQLAAFYSSAKSTGRGIQDDRNREYKYQFLGAESEETVTPNVPFYPELLEQRGTRRQQLARWVTHTENRAFARATVNRAWAILFGRPLVEPVDDIPLAGDFPRGMDLLADDLIQHHYDLARLFRLIAMSRPFQNDSRADFEITSRHEDHWAVFPLVRLRPEQVAGSIQQASSLKTIDADAHIIKRLQKFGQQQNFVERYGDIGEDEFDDRGGTITQRLLMMNGNVVKERTEPNFVMNSSTRIAILAPDDETAVTTAFLAIFTRRPADEEQSHFVDRLRGKKGYARQAAVEDLYWTLMNSTEFSWNH